MEIMSSAAGRSKRWRNSTMKQSKRGMTRRWIRKKRSNWSDLPGDILQLIIGRLSWTDGIHIRAVCKGWSLIKLDDVHDVHGLLPWAMEFPSERNGQLESWLFDPLSREWVVRGKVVRRNFVRPTNEFLFSYEDRKSTLVASVHGWVLVHQSTDDTSLFFLYSPFTAEIIRLPPCSLRWKFNATFSLNATTSPRCVIFQFWKPYGYGLDYPLCFSLCSPGDSSWKAFVFPNPYLLGYVIDAAYDNGVFYCLFDGGELGAFNVKDENWTLLVTQQWTWEERFEYDFAYHSAKLIMSHNGDLRMMLTWKFSRFFKFDSSEMCWVEENTLDNHVLFIGITSFCIPTVGETSQLANSIFSIQTRCLPDGDWVKTLSGCCGWSPLAGGCRCYPRRPEIDSPSPLYYNCVDATVYGMCWIQLPLGGLGRASDLIRAV